MQPHYLNYLRRARSLRGVLATFLLFFPALASAFDRLSERAQSPAWKNLLYYSERIFTAPNGLVDGEGFYLSPGGKSDPEAELRAFLDALQHIDPSREESEQIPCRFPARTRWLREQFPELPKIDIPCPKYDAWLQLSQAQGVALIFSSYYMNNPSSMMGHSFLRFLRTGDRPSPLLDKAVNFSATPTTDLPLVQSLMGLSGYFPGTFSLTPYYSKVQEYANAESRDLWEYSLNFTPEETRRMIDSLWELAPYSIDYYFFDENCSAVLVYLLQNARPGLQLAPDLGTIWVHPSDTLRLLQEHKGLISKVTYRPSSRSRYEEQKSMLVADERRLLARIFEKDSIPADFSSRSEASQARVIDTSLAFIEYDEKLHSSNLPVKHRGLYDELLARRAKNQVPPIRDFPLPENERPDIGHYGQRWGLGLGSWDDKRGAFFEYRPGPHDAASPAVGYPPELSIELGRTQVVLHEERDLYLQRFDLFRILSFNPSKEGRLKWSWRLNMGYRDERGREGFLEGGLGQTLQIGSRRDNYVFLEAEGGARVRDSQGIACAGAVTGLRFALGIDLAQFLEFHYAHCVWEDARIFDERTLQSDWRWRIEDQHEAFLSVRYNGDAEEWNPTLGFFQYF
jgi:hypothetical protein